MFKTIAHMFITLKTQALILLDIIAVMQNYACTLARNVLKLLELCRLCKFSGRGKVLQNATLSRRGYVAKCNTFTKM